ncbi:FAD-dependent monooxygenase [Flavobacterium circumlabens]|uniref:Flavin-dependent monooxygenase n=1 Tax=Flavobacterium circumlabens TaxID=2133765 RepID=A0A4Y7UBF0_9FLAO|nr:NAD(P)/FAD-dependent oxidoreductase [Flavobacterium circumlabens]TCN57437.1 2-polyprenyl-6-methoxyphenol hydroxylase-like FAD-dependent oxidoreductase [Flavobacterium circumlabens]TEB43756.1 FAD-dependent monooxygenase [Flavobacterium circumlabens]
MLLENKQVAIVGGGPGGLTLARLLQLQNAAVKVYERDLNKNARVQGSPLDMHEESGLAAIHKAHLFEAFKTNFMPGADKTLILDENATIHLSDHDTNREEDFGNAYFRPEIDRGALRKMLLESLEPKTIVWDSHFISMEAQEEGWLLHFKNGSSVYADIVIGSDGANSKIRPYITDIKPFYSGITMLEGTIYESEKAAPHIHSLLKGGKIMAFGDTKNILMGQKADDALGFYASFKTDENWAAKSGLDYADPTQILDWFKEEYPEWSSIWYELFENVSVPFIPRPIYCIPLDQTWQSLPNVTIIGDAAHVMPPFAGEGANMAMLDALELSEYLTSDHYKTIPEAIAAYESKMRERAAKAAQESLENGEKMHSKDALQTMLGFFGGE